MIGQAKRVSRPAPDGGWSSPNQASWSGGPRRADLRHRPHSIPRLARGHVVDYGKAAGWPRRGQPRYAVPASCGEEASVIAEPGEHRAAPAGGGLRASHADREQVIEVLKDAFAQGRLTQDELDTRAGQAFASRTYAELATLTADLPGRSAAAKPAAKAAAKPPAGPAGTPARTLDSSAQVGDLYARPARPGGGPRPDQRARLGGPGPHLCGRGGHRGLGLSGVRGGGRLGAAALPRSAAAAASPRRQRTRGRTPRQHRS